MIEALDAGLFFLLQIDGLASRMMSLETRTWNRDAKLLHWHLTLVIVRNQFFVELGRFKHSARRLLHGLTLKSRMFRRRSMALANGRLITAWKTFSRAGDLQPTALRFVRGDFAAPIGLVQIFGCLMSRNIAMSLAGVTRSHLVIIFRYMYLNLNSLIFDSTSKWRNASRERNSRTSCC